MRSAVLRLHAPSAVADPPSDSSRTFLGTDTRAIALGIARMTDAVANSFLIVTLPLWLAHADLGQAPFGLSTSAITGIVLALFGLTTAVVEPIAGRLSDRAGKRRAFVIGGLIALAACDAALAFVGDYVLLVALRIGQGTAAAFTIVTSLAIINEMSDRDDRGRNMGVYSSLRMVGFGAGPLAAGLLLEGGPYVLPWVGEVSGYDAAFGLAAIAALVGMSLVAIFIEDPAHTEASTEDLDLHLTREGDSRRLDPVFSLGAATFLMASCVALLAPIEPQVNERLGQGPFLFSVQIAAFVAVNALAQPLTGAWSDRHGRRRFVLWGLVLLAPTTLVQGFVVAPWQMIAARCAQGLSGAMVFAPAMALAGDLAPEGKSGGQLAVLSVAFGLGLSTGQIATGFLIDLGFVVPFAVGAALAVVGALVVWTQIPPHIGDRP